MIRRLRYRFIILSTAALLLLLGIIVVSSSLLTYRELVADADMVLTMIAEKGEHFQPKLPPEQKEQADSQETRHPVPDRIFMGKHAWSPEMLYEARFFTVQLSAEGEVLFVDTERIAMVDDDEAADYAGQVCGKRGDAGFVGAFRYRKFYSGSDGENDIHVIFLDCGRKLFTFRNSLLINCLISFLGLLVIFVLIVLFSGKIVQPAAESYEKQKQFISVAGHEIKTPITIIDADAELLAMEIGEENEWLKDICKQTGRMAALTNDLLTLSRMDENRQQFTMIEFPISDVVEETVQSFQALAHSRGRNIRTETAPMLSFCGDENSIRQLVGILLDNAIKYSVGTSDGSGDDILLTLAKKNHVLSLRVRNSAAPVSEEQLRHFFDRFYRTEQSRSAETGGYGLGLSIAKSIVEAHKGRITASAPEEKMVQITVTLPFRTG